MLSSLLFSSLLFSCEEVKEQNEIYEKKISSPIPLSANSAEFLALTEIYKENSLLTDKCDCEYKILSVDLPPLGANPRNIAELFSNTFCSAPVGVPACRSFTTNFSSDGLCIDNFGVCNQNWAALMVDYQPFNCLLDAFSGFYTYDFSSYQGVGFGCSNADASGSPKITISIRCQKENSPSCGGTDTNTLTIAAGAFSKLGYFVTGGKCGCVPHFLKPPNN